MSTREPIACLGAGRMGRGIAVVFAYAGHDVVVVDFKPRARGDFQRLAARGAGRDPSAPGAVSPASACSTKRTVAAIADRVGGRCRKAMPARCALLRRRDLRGVPEVLDLKRDVLARASALAGPTPIIASTTSTILADDLAGAVAHPRRFSTRIGSIRLIWCRWSSFHPARRPILRLSRG